MKDTFGEGYLELAEDYENLQPLTKSAVDERIESLDANVIKITEEMRNKILLEGLPDFATGGIVNKGIARLRTAKKFTEGIVDLGLY